MLPSTILNHYSYAFGYFLRNDRIDPKSMHASYLFFVANPYCFDPNGVNVRALICLVKVLILIQIRGMTPMRYY